MPYSRRWAESAEYTGVRRAPAERRRAVLSATVSTRFMTGPSTMRSMKSVERPIVLVRLRCVKPPNRRHWAVSVEVEA